MKRLHFKLILIIIFIFKVNSSQSQDYNRILGLKGSSAEYELENMGFKHVKTEKSGYSSYANWWDARNNKCISVRVEEGRVESVIKAPAFDCNQYTREVNSSYTNNDYQTHQNHYASTSHRRAYDAGFDDGKRDNGYHNTYYDSNDKRAYDEGYNKGTYEQRNPSSHSSSHYTNYKSQVQFRDLNGWYAPSAYNTLIDRNFREIKDYSNDGYHYKIWKNHNTNQCVKTQMRNNKITDIKDSDKCENILGN